MRQHLWPAAMAAALLVGGIPSVKAQNGGAIPGGGTPPMDSTPGVTGTSPGLAPDSGASDRSTVQGEPLQLDPEQKKAILRAVNNDKNKVRQPTNFDVSVGAAVPPSIELYTLPYEALTEVPVTKLYKYTVVGDRVVLVDPLRMRIVEILH